jgi:hypothetical protein
MSMFYSFKTNIITKGNVIKKKKVQKQHKSSVNEVNVVESYTHMIHFRNKIRKKREAKS